MADVKREQELAERRKNEPVPDLAQDHLVRKIFSKFRKPSDGGAPSLSISSRPGSSLPHIPAIQDVEKGEMPQPSQTQEAHKPKQTVSETESRGSSGFSGLSKTSKWASALANVTPTNASVASQPAFTSVDNSRQYKSEFIDSEIMDRQSSDRDDQNMGAVRRTELVCKKSEHIHVVKDIRPPTQGNKWPRVPTSGSARPETIEESNEPQESDSKKMPQISTEGESSKTSDSTKVVIQPKSINSTDYQQIIASLIDMRIDLKLEIQKLSNKVTKIDEHISEIVKKLSAFNLQTEDNNNITITTATKLTKPVSVISANNIIDENEDNIEDSNSTKIKTDLSKKDVKEVKEVSKSADKSGNRSASRTTPIVPLRTINTSSSRRPDTKSQKQVSDNSNNESEEMRAMLENEIAEQDVEMTDDDQDLTSKL